MRVNLAVTDYINMFPQEYKDFLKVIAVQRDGLENEMAEMKGTHFIKRGLSTVPEGLYQMIQKKLGNDQMAEFNALDTQRWFIKEHPQFSLTKYI